MFPPLQLARHYQQGASWGTGEWWEDMQRLRVVAKQFHWPLSALLLLLLACSFNRSCAMDLTTWLAYVCTHMHAINTSCAPVWTSSVPHIACLIKRLQWPMRYLLRELHKEGRSVLPSVGVQLLLAMHHWSRDQVQDALSNSPKRLCQAVSNLQTLVGEAIATAQQPVDRRHAQALRVCNSCW